MKKQWILLLVLAVALTAAPAAMADHCERCKPVSLSCGPTTNYGFEYCEWTWDNNCITENFCGDHVAAATTAALATEFTVASVERLDEPQTAETRVASLDTSTAAANR